jgi:hypothetical protein
VARAAIVAALALSYLYAPVGPMSDRRRGRMLPARPSSRPVPTRVNVASGGTTNITGNTINDNGDDAVELAGGTPNNLDTNTAINSNDDAGILVGGDTSNNINGNAAINANGGRGIVVGAGSDNEIGTDSGNTLDDNSGGNILVSGTATATIQNNTITDAVSPNSR